MGGSSKIATFNHELMEVARIIYNARRYLKNSVSRHTDELSYFVHTILSTNVESSEMILSPSLYAVRANTLLQHQRQKSENNNDSRLLSVLQLMKPVPLSTLAMSSDMLLVLHSSNELHIWSGGLVAGVEYDHLREKLLRDINKTLLATPSIINNGNKNSAATGAPRIVISYENDSNARSLYSRLEPSHMDSEFVNLKYLSALLNLDQLSSLRSKLLPSEELTFHAYVTHLFSKK
jgi:hypothetical protein